MASEVYTAKENGVMGLSSANAVRGRADTAHGRATYPSMNKTKKVPKSDRDFYDDSYVTVYNEKGKVVEKGMWDYSAYRDESTKWNERDGNYDLPRGYKLVIKN